MATRPTRGVDQKAASRLNASRSHARACGTRRRLDFDGCIAGSILDGVSCRCSTIEADLRIPVQAIPSILRVRTYRSLEEPRRCSEYGLRLRHDGLSGDERDNACGSGHHSESRERASRMCGICGAVWSDPTASLAPESLHGHDGPDRPSGAGRRGQYRDDHAALGFRRLSIIDLAGGHQPLSNENGTVWTVFNGEIYNFPALEAAAGSQGA